MTPHAAKQWAKQWKDAAPALQAVRDQELRQLDGDPSRVVAGHRIYERYPQRHGMVIMQRWFERRALISALSAQSDR